MNKYQCILFGGILTTLLYIAAIELGMYKITTSSLLVSATGLFVSFYLLNDW